MMKTKIKFIGVLLLVLLMTACPSKSDLDKAASASRELAHDTVTGEKVTATLYQNNRLSLAKKDSLAQKFKFIATEGARANGVVVQLNEQEKAGKLPANAAQIINQNFATIFAAFNDLMNEINSLPQSEQKELTTATKSLSSDVAAIKKVGEK